MENTNDLNIVRFDPLMTPAELKADVPLTDKAASAVAAGRRAIQAVMRREDPRRIVVVGPCSIHETDASFEYACRLAALAGEVSDRVLLVMRAYLEKPRTTLGWKGILYDPYLDESDDMHEGFRRSRRLLLRLSELGVPIGSEILDPIVPQYVADLISWASIGARTAESQIHRQMASGLSMPIGFKNSTDGSLAGAIAGMRASASPHSFLGITADGRVSIVSTRGNPYTHVVLRGGTQGPNYQSEHIAFTEALLRREGLDPRILVDCSHANSNKDPKLQGVVFMDVLAQIRQGCRSIMGMMLESFLEEGNQPIPRDRALLRYGVSITDKCIGWEETTELVRALARSVPAH